MIRIYREHEEPLVLNVPALQQIHIKGFSFHRCFLNGLDFSGAVLADIDFRSAEMNGAVFASAVFERARLIMVESKAACYDACQFRNTVLFYCNMSGSSFRSADLSGGTVKEVVFCNCDLRGADLSCEGLESCKFEGALYDDTTVWHERYQAECSGALKLVSK